eukprot:m51a1_g14032 putative small gtp-binding protein (177) ;mRNA; r:1149025-1152817
MGDQPYRVVLLGDKGAGKTSLILRATEDRWTGVKNTNIPDAKQRSIQCDGSKSTVTMCDTAGEESCRTIASSFYKNAHGILLAFDIADSESFDNTKMWMGEINMYAHEDVVKVLVGNKSDLADSRQVTTHTAALLAKEMGVGYIEVSAKTGQNVDDALQQDQIITGLEAARAKLKK